jgi:hypothetical protein
MSKEEKIKTAWNDLINGIAEYSYVEGYLSINGWLPVNLLSQNIILKLASKLDNKFVINGDFIRPISLNGIEDNNGWIKVKSEADFPLDKKSRYWIANENGIFDFFGTAETIETKFKNKTLTHYKKLEEPSIYVW